MIRSCTTRVVAASLTVHALCAALGLLAAARTSSVVLLSEVVHAVAAAASQALLLHGLGRTAATSHSAPQTSSNELPFWAFVVASLLFSLGSGVAIDQSIMRWRSPQPVGDAMLGLAGLGGAALAEFGLVALAVQAFGARGDGRGLVAALRSPSDPALFTVLLQSLSGLCGLLIAMAGIVATVYLGWDVADAAAAMIIGLLLGTVGALMAIETRKQLLTSSPAPAVRLQSRPSPVAALPATPSPDGSLGSGVQPVAAATPSRSEAVPSAPPFGNVRPPKSGKTKKNTRSR